MVAVQGLRKSFQTPGEQIDVLRGIDLQIKKNERVAVVGTSGAGKTTLMHILGGLDAPTSGEVRVKGQDLFSLRATALDAFRNHTVGFVFQFHQLLPEFTALENVMMPRLIAGESRRSAAEKATAILAEVGLEHRVKHKPGALSGGEQQRVAIARALVNEPQLLLADEPTGNLDTGTSDEILSLLNRMHDNRGLTMVIVTHNMPLAAELDRIVKIEDGVLAGDVLN
ncbi:MAG: ABC transporter ATP-binding protein [Pelovirga sp.]